MNADPAVAPVLSVNARAQPLVERLIADAAELDVAVERDASGVTLIDAGIDVRGGIEAGLRMGEICLGGLGRVSLRPGMGEGWPTWVEVASSQPVIGCLASQYAGWSLAASKEETGGKKFFSLGSGPARALAAKETLFDELGYRDQAATGVLVLEVDRRPPAVVIEKILRDCRLAAEGLTIVVAPTSSLAGTTQVVTRVLETGLHKAHELGFDLTRVVEGAGAAPLPAPSPDGVEAMGRTNDAILYGGRVHLTVDCDDDAARDLAQKLPSRNSRDHGRSFAEIFKEVEYDFYKIDGALFAPAEVWVTNIRSGNTWHGGGLELGLLQRLWQKEA
ncbi:MAG: methenyltetrahydromethanopterin cyclohydrolase [Proteobacteria bacterium]|nr:methenyltetrahydromethanopterin cyclohydrolase [Pseudomonadota bacterium]